MIHRRPIAVLAVCCSLLVAACGSDDDSSKGGGVDAFCAILNQDDPGDDPDVVRGEFERLVAAAPADIKDDVEVIAAVSLGAGDLAEGASDEEVQEALDRFSEAEAAFDRVDRWAEENCGEGLSP